MSEKDEEDFVEYSPEAKAQMEADPELAVFMRDMAASMRQAMHGVKTGKYESFDDAMEAITGVRPIAIDMDDVEDV